MNAMEKKVGNGNKILGSNLNAVAMYELKPAFLFPLMFEIMYIHSEIIIINKKMIVFVF